MATTSTQNGPSGVVENSTSNLKLVAQIIERGLTHEPMFNNAPDLLSALREGQVRCRVSSELPDGVRWAYRQRRDTDPTTAPSWVLLIHPSIWADGLANTLVGAAS
jgi:hypothetical protein